MSLKDIPGMEREVTEAHSPDISPELQESARLLIERENPMSDVAEKILEQL